MGALGDWLRPLQQQWHAGIRWDSLPWFAEEKARQGAYAALLGLKFDRTDAVRRGAFSFVRSMLGLRTKKHPRWEGFAVGDCCVFQVRGEFLLRAFPVERSADFDNRPFLLGSNLSSNASIKEAIRHLEGEFQADDLFVLASDALAKWFLGRHEAGEKPWNRLTALASPGDFERFVAGLRTAAELRNDDTTLVLIRWAGKSSRTPPQRRLVATGLPEPE